MGYLSVYYNTELQGRFIIKKIMKKWLLFKKQSYDSFHLIENESYTA